MRLGDVGARRECEVKPEAVFDALLVFFVLHRKT